MCWGASPGRASADSEGAAPAIQVKIPARRSETPTRVDASDLGGGLIEFLVTGELRPRPPLRSGSCGPQEAPDTFRAPDLGGGFVEFVVNGRIDAKPRAQQTGCAMPMPAPSTAAPSFEVRSYGGSQAPGSLIVNMTRREIYRVLEGGLVAVYRTNGDPLTFVVRERLKPAATRDEPQVTGSVKSYPKWEMVDGNVVISSDAENKN
jgi:hypothetical protein